MEYGGSMKRKSAVLSGRGILRASACWMSGRRGGGEVEAGEFSVEFLGDVDGGAGAAHRIDNEVAFAGVAGEKLPEDPGGGCADVVFVAVGRAAVVLGGVFPEGGGVEGEGGFVQGMRFSRRTWKPAWVKCSSEVAALRSLRSLINKKEMQSVRDQSLSGRD